MLKRIIRMIKGSIEASRREKELKVLLAGEKDETKLRGLKNELSELGFMGVMVCKQCNSYRSDLEWREKKILNCQKCGSNKITYPPKIPQMVILRLALRFVIKGY